jgi:glycosidase
LPGDGDGGVAGGADAGELADADLGPDAEVCDDLASCPVTFSYPANGAATVELRGSFRADGWDNGEALTLNGDAFEVTVDLDDGQRVEYKFVVDGDWVTDPNNPNTADDGFGGVNSVVTADCDDCDTLANFDWRDGIMYFVMVDRFFDGDDTNNVPVNDVELPANFQGGDLAGVLAKIEDGYFTDLGVNVLWLTAPIDNADGRGLGIGMDDNYYSSYHGYWPTDLNAVEDRIGDMNDLMSVVEAAHVRGIKVILDYVMNHVHTDSAVYQDNPDWFWPLGNCVCGEGCSWDGAEGRRCWFTPYLADFDFNNTAARNFSVDNAVQWAIDTGIDGYRLDAVKHIETPWITDLRARIDAEVDTGSAFYMVGETYTGDRDLIRSYVNPATMLDGQFDFPLRAEIIKAIMARTGSMTDLVSFMDSNEDFYGGGSVMGTFIGNHDVPRSIHMAEDSSLFGEWDPGKSRGWANQPGLPASDRPFQRVGVAFALLMTTPGVPLIYYGDEIGMAGAGDPDNRRFMQWEGLSANQSWLRDRIEALTSIRSAHPALRRGTRTTLGSSADSYVYRMSEGSDRVFVALNRGDASVAAGGLPAGSYTDLITGDSITAPTDIPARSALILVEQ